jgi:hypothetical protein
MSDTKKIKINPNIFKIAHTTNKNKTIKAYQPVSPNLLRNKFIQNVLKKKNDTIQKNSSTSKPPASSPQPEADKYTNEFKESIEYLQMLSNESKHKTAQLKKESDKKNVLKELQKTIRAPNILQYNTPAPTPLRINLELPNELQIQPVKPDLNIDDFQTFDAIYKTPTHYKVDNSVPYGCLKGGVKKTYKSYKNIVPETTPTLPMSLPPPPPPSERELKLNKMKETILFQSNIKKQKELSSASTLTPSSSTSISTSNPLPKTSSHGPRKIKTTTLRKFVLGKSKTTRSIGVLIKNNNTKKNVIDKIKELKRIPLKEVKAGLQKSNLIKCGSNAPNDVLRQMYESSMLAGDITNMNKDLILHNLVNEKNREF